MGLVMSINCQYCTLLTCPPPPPFFPGALAAYEWLLCYLWVESQKKLEKELAAGKVYMLQCQYDQMVM